MKCPGGHSRKLIDCAACASPSSGCSARLVFLDVRTARRRPHKVDRSPCFTCGDGPSPRMPPYYSPVLRCGKPRPAATQGNRITTFVSFSAVPATVHTGESRNPASAIGVHNSPRPAESWLEKICSGFLARITLESSTMVSPGYSPILVNSAQNVFTVPRETRSPRSS